MRRSLVAALPNYTPNTRGNDMTVTVDEVLDTPLTARDLLNPDRVSERVRAAEQNEEAREAEREAAAANAEKALAATLKPLLDAQVAGLAAIETLVASLTTWYNARLEHDRAIKTATRFGVSGVRRIEPVGIQALRGTTPDDPAWELRLLLDAYAKTKVTPLP
jgi:hypothetical protein